MKPSEHNGNFQPYENLSTRQKRISEGHQGGGLKWQMSQEAGLDKMRL